ncbi:MAG: hypothetical protein WCV64_10345, partial [Desulfurivibrionaceae bacterium]
QLLQLTNVLQAPNAALRWSPPVKEGEAEIGTKKEEMNGGKKPSSAQGPPKSKSSGRLWVLDEKQKLRQIEVQTGPSDGTNTAVESAELREGMQVITGIRMSEADKNGGGSPFTPQFGRGNKAKGDK